MSYIIQEKIENQGYIAVSEGSIYTIFKKVDAKATSKMGYLSLEGLKLDVDYIAYSLNLRTPIKTEEISMLSDVIRLANGELVMQKASR